MTSPTTVTGVDFATVFVKDYPAALKFYGETLGLEHSVDYEKIPAGEFETGNLTLHGVTRPITLHAKLVGGGINPLDKKYTAGFEVSGRIKRSDFGVKTYLPLIGDDVDLIISAGFEHS